MVREAVNCFYKAKDHARLFECKLVCLITEEFDGVSYTQLAAEVLQTAPEKILKEHLLSVLRLCYALYAGCQFDAFEEQMKRAKRWIKATGNEQLMGEWHLLYALSSFPNIAGMKKSYLAAESLMESPSELFTKEEPFLFGCTSMWYLFYSEPVTSAGIRACGICAFWRFSANPRPAQHSSSWYFRMSGFSGSGTLT